MQLTNGKYYWSILTNRQKQNAEKIKTKKKTYTFIYPIINFMELINNCSFSHSLFLVGNVFVIILRSANFILAKYEYILSGLK